MFTVTAGTIAKEHEKDRGEREVEEGERINWRKRRIGRQIGVEEGERINRIKRRIGKQIEVEEGERINRSKRRIGKQI